MAELLLKKQSASESARDYTYRMMKKNMLQMRFFPGEMLSEAAAANLLQVSRTPIHDTFARLAQEKLVNVVAQKGTEVALIDPERVRQAVFVKGQLCEAVMQKLCEEGIAQEVLFALETNQKQQYFMLSGAQYDKIKALDSAFYRHCFVACGQDKVWDVTQSLCYDMDRTQALAGRTQAQWTQAVQAQEALFHALCQRDAPMACAQAHSNIQQVLTLLPALQIQYPNYFKEYSQNNREEPEWQLH